VDENEKSMRKADMKEGRLEKGPDLMSTHPSSFSIKNKKAGANITGSENFCSEQRTEEGSSGGQKPGDGFLDTSLYKKKERGDSGVTKMPKPDVRANKEGKCGLLQGRE